MPAIEEEALEAQGTLDTSIQDKLAEFESRISVLEQRQALPAQQVSSAAHPLTEAGSDFLPLIGKL